MIIISVKDALKTLDSAKEQLSERQLNSVISRAINESILQGRTEARASVKSLYNIPQRYVSGINVDRATPGLLIAKLNASSTPIPMDAFAPKFQTAAKSLTISKRGEQKQRTFKRAKSNYAVGVSIEVVKGKRETVPYAFLIPGAKPRVFARGEYRNGTAYGFVQRNKRVNKDGSDKPVKPLLSITTHAAVINKESLNRIETRVNSVFPVSIQRNIEFMLSKVST
ncbi:hypothetical protein [Pinibacter soli]|uniref:Prophage minor tail protein Z (GPZ) n=1 Tax=Pinibacter soli TaxID=3044211 RepID=A0ABT6RBU4_9BACT|nr:hypothetical protein [Pinibacter soli]MDI3319978.1 hypothetical protein [Pinibacter soli]